MNLGYTKILSPISGVVGLRQVDPGNIVHASDTNGLLVVTQLQPISVVFDVSEDDLPQVQAQLRTGAYARTTRWSCPRSTGNTTGRCWPS